MGVRRRRGEERRTVRWGADDWGSVTRDIGEAVSIARPNHLHPEVAVGAARAGKLVWFENPCGRVPAVPAPASATGPTGGAERVGE